MKFNLPKSNGMLPTDQHRALKNYRLMTWAKIATFGLYMVAVFMLYVSDVWGVASFVEKNSNEFIALTVFSIISFVLAFFLASSKEAVYEDIALHRSEGWKLKPTQYAAMGLFLSSGILFEMFSTTNNQQHIANTAAEQSTMMKSIQGTEVSLSGSSNLTDSFASAQMKLAQCKERLNQGKEKHCQGATARVDAIRESMAMSNQLATTAAQQSVDNKVDGMLKIREHFDKPMFQAIGKATGTDNNSGMLMVVGALIFVFELQHIMALFAYSNSLARINRKVGNAGNAGNSDNAGYATPTPFGTAPVSGFANAAKQTVGEYAQKFEDGLKASPEIIATEYARANAGNNRLMEDAGNVAGQLGAKIDGAINPKVRFFKLILAEAQAQVNHGLAPTHENLRGVVNDVLSKTSRMMGKEANVSDADRETLTNLVGKHLNKGTDLYRPTLKESSGFKQSPEQKAFVMAEYAKQIQEYERAKQSALSGENTVRYLTGNTAPSVPFHQQHGATGIHNPALGTAEEHFPLPLQSPVSACTVQVKQAATDSPVSAEKHATESPVSACTVQVATEGKPFTDSIYEQLKKQVIACELAPQFRPVKAVLKELGVGSSDAQRQRMAAAALNRMNSEGVLKLNDEAAAAGKLKAKYILA
jgi:hypothetical protein